MLVTGSSTALIGLILLHASAQGHAEAARSQTASCSGTPSRRGAWW
jgi:hypothetical protein